MLEKIYSWGWGLKGNGEIGGIVSAQLLKGV
jgi:hypothetical protein